MDDLPDDVEALRRVRFFEDLTPEDLDRIAGIGERRSFEPGEAIVHKDDDTGGLYIWKQIWYVTPLGESGTLTRGSQGFAAEELVTCTYIGAESGNDYTVVGFYPEK